MLSAPLRAACGMRGCRLQLTESPPLPECPPLSPKHGCPHQLRLPYKMLPTGYHEHQTSVTSSEGDKGKREQGVSVVGLQQEYPSWLCVAAFFRVLTRRGSIIYPPMMSGNPNASHIPTQKPSHRRVGIGDKHWSMTTHKHRSCS